jgi:hypothetical protein
MEMELSRLERYSYWQERYQHGGSYGHHHSSLEGVGDNPSFPTECRVKPKDQFARSGSNAMSTLPPFLKVLLVCSTTLVRGGVVVGQCHSLSLLWSDSRDGYLLIILPSFSSITQEFYRFPSSLGRVCVLLPQ